MPDTKQLNSPLMNLANTYIPSLAVISMLLFAVYTTLTVSSERSKIYSRFETQDRKIHEVVKAVENLAKTMTHGRAKGLTSNDYVADCLRHQILNPGWQCRYSNRTSKEVNEVLPWQVKPSVHLNKSR